MENIKGKIYLTVFITVSLILGLGVWNNYRPQIIYASCADIAEKTSNIIQNKEIVMVNEESAFDQNLNDCLSGAGYFGK